MKKSNWIPEIFYEENSSIPFIEVPKGEKDPAVLFIFVNRLTGESTVGLNGKEVPTIDMHLRQFVDMNILKEGLTPEEYDRVRNVAGLEDLATATKKGKNISSKINLNIQKQNNK